MSIADSQLARAETKLASHYSSGATYKGYYSIEEAHIWYVDALNRGIVIEYDTYRGSRPLPTPIPTPANLPPPPAKLDGKYYVVTKGLDVGVFATWYVLYPLMPNTKSLIL